MSKCTCRICEEIKKVNAVIDSRDPDQLIALVRDLFTRVANLEQDNDYYECILNGSWPSAKMILENALSKIPKEENDSTKG